MVYRFLAVLLIAATSTPALVSIKATNVVMAGQTVRIVCKVPRRSENRVLHVGIANYQSSERQLDGEASRITWEFYFDHVPCGVGPSFCSVDAQDRQQLVTSTLEVANCEP